MEICYVQTAHERALQQKERFSAALIFPVDEKRYGCACLEYFHLNIDCTFFQLYAHTPQMGHAVADGVGDVATPRVVPV
jgi:hypothetical protein